jgi:hypothetical protein
VTDLRVRLRAGDRAAAELDVALPGERALETLGVVLDSRARSRPEVGDDVARAPVAGGQGGVVAVVVARGGGDVAACAQPCFDLADAALGAGAPDVPGGHERDDPGIDLASRRGLEAGRRPDRLGRRVGGAVRAQPLRNPEPEHARDTDPDQGDDQHAAAVPMHE